MKPAISITLPLCYSTAFMTEPVMNAKLVSIATADKWFSCNGKLFLLFGIPYLCCFFSAVF